MTNMELHGIITLAVALVAQLDRVSDYESEGQGFESLRARHERNLFCLPRQERFFHAFRGKTALNIGKYR